MKKRFVHTILYFLTAQSMLAQAPEKIRISQVNVDADAEQVNVSFVADLHRKTSTGSSTVVYAPVITNGEHKVSLPAIVVRNGRARTRWARHEWAAGTTATYENGIYTRNGNTVDYKANVPFQPWMGDARIDVETVTTECGGALMQAFTLTNPMLPKTEFEAIQEFTPVAPKEEVTVTQFLAKTFSFVLPASDFNPNQPIRFYDDERDNALTIYFKMNNFNIDRNYMGNDQTLTNMISAIQLIRESGDGEVAHVVVAGFTSPEGTAELNDRLAWERAVSVKEYILKQTGVEDFKIVLVNGSADWHYMRQLIAADPNVPARREVLNIIDNHPIWNPLTLTGRQTLIRQLRGGQSWRYITRNIFPKLRNGAFIRVYFNEKQ